LRDEAYTRLRDWILDGTLAPNEPLRDEALAEGMGMSRTPVREALQRLEDDGLVITAANRRTFVSPVSLHQAREIYPIVASLEDLALELAAPRLDADTLKRMREANRELEEALAVGDAAAAQAADTAFHVVIVERCGNQELVSTLAELKPKVRRIERVFWGSADRSASVVDHNQLIAAIERSDRSSARRLLRRNWERGLRWLNPEAT
jgi:DNA-binding GntR family transcriptional regulator